MLRDTVSFGSTVRIATSAGVFEGELLANFPSYGGQKAILKQRRGSVEVEFPRDWSKVEVLS